MGRMYRLLVGRVMVTRVREVAVETMAEEELAGTGAEETTVVTLAEELVETTISSNKWVLTRKIVNLCTRVLVLRFQIIKDLCKLHFKDIHKGQRGLKMGTPQTPQTQ